jgi:hypothetical protein
VSPNVDKTGQPPGVVLEVIVSLDNTKKEKKSRGLVFLLAGKVSSQLTVHLNTIVCLPRCSGEFCVLLHAAPSIPPTVLDENGLDSRVQYHSRLQEAGWSQDIESGGFLRAVSKCNSPDIETPTTAIPFTLGHFAECQGLKPIPCLTTAMHEVGDVVDCTTASPRRCPVRPQPFPSCDTGWERNLPCCEQDAMSCQLAFVLFL